ncbi:MFS general substrate transporter [Polychaeton citri CBS 116435]|uniref:MFS general substrate transporter n=1 Tax=Polychaeton citri CBS 116435 TaxID=1314669 RepID=A0A9P4QEE6_9PEZI|nr:MFS general substrate transporter [Polychaeton citri CBS 116435]
MSTYITNQRDPSAAGAVGESIPTTNAKVELDADDEVKQDGVRRTEAITAVWNKKMLVAVFILSSVQSNLKPYITSSFESHGLTAVVSIVATITGGVCNLFIAKLIDIWGRVEGFFFMLLLIVVGCIMLADCQSIQMYAAANTIYWVGHIGFLYVVTIILTDITTLRNRVLMYGIYNTPTIATAFAGSKIAADFINESTWRWAFGAFIIVLCATCIPVGAIFYWSVRACKRSGTWPERIQTRTYWETIKYYFVQFDAVGWSLLLLPFSLSSYAPDGWSTYYIILMIVLGVVCLAAFVLWERFIAPFLKNRTILDSCFMYGLMFLSIYCWDTYYYSYLQVVNRQSITTAGYILNSFSLMASFISPFTGLVLRYWGSPKWLSIGVTPFAVLGTALLIHFRHPGTDVGWLVMCQLFSGIYSGVWALTGQLIITACVNHQEIAVALALYGLFGAIGASVGEAIAGALWTNIFPKRLYEYLPMDTKNFTATIYADIETQMSYEGTPTGDAINHAYGYVMRLMVICGVCFIPLCVGCIVLWKNIDTKHPEKEQGKQPKGTRF